MSLRNLLRRSLSFGLSEYSPKFRLHNATKTVSVSGARRYRHHQPSQVSTPKQETHSRSISMAVPKEIQTEEFETSRPRVVDARQGEKIHAAFSIAEFQRRLDRLRQHMESQNIGAAIFTSFHNVNYYSGFVYTSFGRPYGLVVTPSRTVVVAAGIDGGQPWRQSLGADDCVTYTDWNRDNFYKALRMVIGNIDNRIGLEYDHITLETRRKFDAALPDNIKLDISEPVMYLRLTKSAEEIKLIKEGARIADIGGAAGVEAIREGVPEFEVARASTNAMVKEIAATYPKVELIDTWTWFQSGINTDGAHNPVTCRKVQKGDILSLNCFPMIAGYYTALERTLFYGQPSDEHMRLWQINCDVHRHGLSLLKPGARCSDIVAELNDIYRAHDLLQYRSFGYGHSFGSMSHYYGREAVVELREDIGTRLEPGMVISMEPMINIPIDQPGGGGYREHDIVVITENGAENITKFPFGPEHNIILK